MSMSRTISTLAMAALLLVGADAGAQEAPPSNPSGTSGPVPGSQNPPPTGETPKPGDRKRE